MLARPNHQDSTSKGVDMKPVLRGLMAFGVAAALASTAAAADTSKRPIMLPKTIPVAADPAAPTAAVPVATNPNCTYVVDTGSAHHLLHKRFGKHLGGSFSGGFGGRAGLDGSRIAGKYDGSRLDALGDKAELFAEAKRSE